MRLLTVSLAAVLLALPLHVRGAWQAASPTPNPPKIGFEMQKVAEGVYVAVRTEPPAVFVDANTVFIVNERDVIVVDANLTPGSARECIAALRKITDKPVTHVINTHWHQDHVAGNQAYADAFPGVEIVAHARTRTELIAKGEETRKLYLDAGPKFAARLRGAVEKNESFFGAPMHPDEHASYLAAAGLIDRYVSEAPGMRTVLPTIAIEDRLTLHRGERVIDVRYLGRGHTDKDLVVHLPKESVLITGDLVVAPVPLVGDQSFVADWAATLDRMRELAPSVIVPGHGPVLRDDAYVRQLGELLTYISKQADAAVARGATLEEARQGMGLGEWRKRFAGESQSLRLIFGDYVVGGGVAKAYLEARERAPKAATTP